MSRGWWLQVGGSTCVARPQPHPSPGKMEEAQKDGDTNKHNIFFLV